MTRYVAILFRGTFQEFDVAQEFTDAGEARAFALTRHDDCVVLSEGNLDDWLAGRITYPVAIYCYGIEYGPLRISGEPG
ncbi:MAG: hypothetical protein K8J31_05455 [Anaerolineae bacterium]|nr:hypothetical protein [Anaerolineae bacterium]